MRPPKRPAGPPKIKTTDRPSGNEPRAPRPDLTGRVLYRDALMLIIDKPAGIPVHAGPGGGPNLEQGFDALRLGLPKPPGLAHRLDRDTSGCLVLGRHPKALRKLGKLFQDGLAAKTYWAVVSGPGPAAESGTVDAPLFKQTNPRGGWRIVIDPQGQKAVTHWQVLGRGTGADGQPVCWMAFSPQTGRTHQIRVHAASLGCPLLGDPQYGGPDGMPLHLHARAITLPLYASRPPITVTAPLPPHLQKSFAACGWQAAQEAAYIDISAPVAKVPEDPA